MNDIAKSLGVSRPVVSSVFSSRTSGTVRVSDKTRQRVLKAAREIGYRPNHIARSVATGKTEVIAFVGGVMHVDFIMQTLSGVMAEAENHGYIVKVMQVPDQGWSPRKVADVLLGRRVDGVIFFHITNDIWPRLIEEMGGAIPIVALSCAGTSGSLASVDTDDLDGYEQIVDHLVALGHRRIAMIGGAPVVKPNERSAEFKQAMRQKGLSLAPGMVQASNWSLETSERIAGELLSRPADQRPTAICCACDAMAMVVLRRARAMGLDVPSDLSVVGFGETNVAPIADPALTSVDQSYGRMGSLACEQLLTCLEGSGRRSRVNVEQTRHLTVPARLVLRQSTARACDIR